MGELGLIMEGVDVGEDISLSMSLRIISTAGVLDNGLDVSLIEANNFLRKSKIGRLGCEGLSMMETYN